jgi:hypothetical protein
MNKSVLLFFLALILILPRQALGYSLYFNLSEPVLGLNETTEASVWISGLGDQTPPNLGAYDLEIAYDPNVLRYDSLTFSSYLGYPGNSLSSFEIKNPGTLAVLEVSLLLNGALEALQPGTFPLVSLQFTMTALENSTLRFLKANLSDGDGYPLYADLQSATVYAVPIPSPLLLLSGAILGLGAWRRKRLRA